MFQNAECQHFVTSSEVGLWELTSSVPSFRDQNIRKITVQDAKKTPRVSIPQPKLANPKKKQTPLCPPSPNPLLISPSQIQTQPNVGRKSIQS